AASLAVVPAWSAGPAEASDDAAIDALALAFLTRFEVPGLAIAIVRPGRPDFARGYGVRSLGSPPRADAHTLFGIASNSKAFTAAALAILVDEGKVGWDEPVLRYLPAFRMYDPAVTGMMTVRDLLVHRSGLALGAGDLMQFPETTHTLADILHGLQYLKPARGFRAGYAYDNILYIVAGMLITSVTGQSWEDFVTARILVPLGMRETVAARSRIRTPNLAGRHARLGPPVRGMGPMRVVQPDEQDKIDAAGGINTNARDVAAWFHVQLRQGALPDGGRLWSEAQAREMWTPQTISASGAGPTAEMPTRAVMSGYALGWGVQDYRGHRLLSHSGGLTGQVTQHALLPELGCAVAVYTNSEDNSSAGLRNALLDRLIGAPPFDWVAATATRIARTNAEALKESGGGAPAPPAGGLTLPLDRYAGRYRDLWYGDIVVARRGAGLRIDFARTPAFRSALEPWGADAFRTRFPEGVGEDAVVTFAVKDGAVAGVTMKPLSPLADFSFDFQHLAFAPVR
ncbi:serine hydrolase, partial [Sphingomonas bacterium]|uniref:serine hydrolase n=1 Tax=Sphingomonas bacterium TaxID=1895847 RepID=UPI00157743E9